MMACSIGEAIRIVQQKALTAYKSRACNVSSMQPRLVAVSKTKPKELIIEAYDSGQRHFGENYVKELIEKASDPDILQQCKDIQWHFIGRIQTNKVNKIVSIPSLFVVETVDSEKVASALNDAWGKKQPDADTLRVMVQVNTSAEENKGGCAPEACIHLTEYIMQQCPHLKFIGLMTIGSFDVQHTSGPNPDFASLVQCRGNICQKLKLDDNEVELSMGMSNDYEEAVSMGSTNIRVGSTIFGVRSVPPETTNTHEVESGIEKLEIK